ncbi:MAG: Hint domain-containing protein, partial [Nevskiales bacterium]
LDSGLTVADSSSTTLTSAAIVLGGDLVAGDTLNFTNQNGITGSYNPATWVLTLSGSAGVAAYRTALGSIAYSFSGDATAGGTAPTRTVAWAVSDSNDNNSLAAASSLNIACFRSGTRITAEHGDVPVEALRIGDRVRTRGGEMPIRWIGHRKIDVCRHPRPDAVWPVRILAHAFGDDLPRRDLLLSPDHAVHIGGVLIPIRYLVNGATIAQEEADAVTYWHVELEHHDVILAEGLPCESYLDTGNRAAFANGGTLVQAHPDFSRRVWESQACAKLVLNGAELAAARSLLLERAVAIGHAITGDASLRLVADGYAMAPEITGRLHRFHLPALACRTTLVSRNAVPAEIRADSDDHRRLGVAISRVLLDGRSVALDDAALGCGWHEVEAGEGAAPGWRWTDGDASLAIVGVQVLEVEVAITEQYWVGQAKSQRHRRQGIGF